MTKYHPAETILVNTVLFVKTAMSTDNVRILVSILGSFQGNILLGLLGFFLTQAF